MKSIDQELYNIIGTKLKEKRLQKQYSLEKLATEVNKLIDQNNKQTNNTTKHIIRQSLNKMELGKLRIDTTIFFIICKALDINPDTLLPKNNIQNNKYDNKIISLATKNGIKISYDKNKPLTQDDYDEIKKIIEEEISKNKK